MSNNLLPGFLIIIVFVVFMIIKRAKSSLMTDIERDAKIFFNAREDLSGNLVLKFQGYTILLEYDLANNTRGLSEYIIANIKLPRLNEEQIKACKKFVDIKESGEKLYAIIYTSWGYQGEKFRKRLEEKLTQLSACINQ